MALPTVAIGIPMTTAVLALAAVARRQASKRPALLFLTMKNYPRSSYLPRSYPNVSIETLPIAHRRYL
jgi:hypothetical protein